MCRLSALLPLILHVGNSTWVFSPEPLLMTWISQGSCALERTPVGMINRKGLSAYKSLEGMEEGKVPRVTFKNDSQN